MYLGTFPIDTTKTRLQVQGQVSDAKFREVKYNGMIHAILRISKEEGVQALYSGLVAFQFFIERMQIILAVQLYFVSISLLKKIA